MDFPLLIKIDKNVTSFETTMYDIERNDVLVGIISNLAHNLVF